MSDQSELDDGTGSPFLDGLSAFEAGVSKSEAVPDAMFAEPWFGLDSAGFGLLVGRNKVIDVRVGPQGRETRIGRFTGNRRRPISTAGVAKAFGMSVAQSERMLDHVEQALRAGIAAYRETYRTLALEAFGTEDPAGVRLTPALHQDVHQEVIEEVRYAQRQQALRDRLDTGAGTRPPRPRQPGPRRPSAPDVPPRTERDTPGRSSGRSL